MQPQTRESIAGGTRFLAKEVLREPVRDAVREALREEALSVRPAGGGESRTDDGRSTSSHRTSGDDGGSDGSADARSGVSKLAMAVGVVALVGVAMVARRRRRSSTQSDLTSFDEGGTGGGFDGGAGGATGGGDSVGTSGGGVESDEPGTSTTAQRE